jgi:ATP phosphoribosyltransferase
LPKGRLLKQTSALANISGWRLSGYTEDARLYHLSSARFPDLNAKIFQEKDIPVQVGTGAYDLGICGLDWIQEQLVKYPNSGLIKLRNLGYGDTSLFLCASGSSALADPAAFNACSEVISLASEYPNLAETLALSLRLKRFNIFPVWGAAEIYPPENADLVILPGRNRQDIYSGLVPLMKVLDCNAYLIANKTSWETKDLSEILESIYVNLPSFVPARPQPAENRPRQKGVPPQFSAEMVRLALPDGHAQKHVTEVLNRAGINIRDYPSFDGSRRPDVDLPGVVIKVIRPQDMPLQVANNKFDMAITGQDWVKEHLYKFPLSPIVELADLKCSRVKIVAAVHNRIPASDIMGLRKYAVERSLRLRVASEYISIADKYARDHHLGMYRIIPTWGATESFLPDDADLLIENTETGGTLKRHNLKIIETLFESTACLIAGVDALNSNKGGKIRDINMTLQKAVPE